MFEIGFGVCTGVLFVDLLLFHEVGFVDEVFREVLKEFMFWDQGPRVDEGDKVCELVNLSVLV